MLVSSCSGFGAQASANGGTKRQFPTAFAGSRSALRSRPGDDGRTRVPSDCTSYAVRAATGGRQPRDCSLFLQRQTLAPHLPRNNRIRADAGTGDHSIAAKARPLFKQKPLSTAFGSAVLRFLPELQWKCRSGAFQVHRAIKGG